MAVGPAVQAPAWLAPWAASAGVPLPGASLWDSDQQHVKRHGPLISA